jgi:hypothetical protein
MKKTIIFSTVMIVSGLLIALGPTFLFKACPTGCCCSIRPDCLWSIKTELGMGMVIASLGISFFLYNNNPKTQAGITIGIFLAGVMVLLIPHVIIGGCAIKSMECRLVTFPVLTVLGIFVVLCSGIRILRNLKVVLPG